MDTITTAQVSDDELLAALAVSPEFITVTDEAHLAELLGVTPEPATTENLPDIICRVMAWWITSGLDDGSSLSGATLAIPTTEYRRERLTTWIREMGRPAAIDALRAYAKSPAELRAIDAAS